MRRELKQPRKNELRHDEATALLQPLDSVIELLSRIATDEVEERVSLRCANPGQIWPLCFSVAIQRSVDTVIPSEY